MSSHLLSGKHTQFRYDGQVLQLTRALQTRDMSMHILWVTIGLSTSSKTAGMAQQLCKNVPTQSIICQ